MQSHITQYMEKTDTEESSNVDGENEVFGDTHELDSVADAPVSTIEPSVANDTASKRPRPDSDLSPSSRLSPVSKKVIYVGGEAVYTFDEEPPTWLPLISKIMDKVNDNLCELKESVKGVAALQNSFDEHRRVTDEKIDKLEAAAAEFRSSTLGRIRKLEDALKESESRSDAKIQELEKYVQFLDASFEEQKQINEETKENFHKNFEFCDAQEQYSRRNCLVMHGIPETEKEDTDSVVIDAVKTNLNVTLAKSDIDRSHRIGQKNNSSKRPRALIVKFSRYNVRASVFREKRKLKGTNIMLTESLTNNRIQTLKKAKSYYGMKNVWTSDGEILTKIKDKIVNVTHKQVKLPQD